MLSLIARQLGSGDFSVEDTLFAVVVLSVLSAVGVGVAFAIARRTKRVLSFRVLVVVNYVLTNLVSGIAHLLEVSDGKRGYFDVLVWLQPGELEQVVFIQALGLIAVCAGALWKLPTVSPAPVQALTLNPRDRAMLPVAILILLPISLWASIRIREYAAGLDVERIISVSGGMARYSFISHWFVWAVSLLVLLFVASRSKQYGLWPATALGIGVLAIAASLQWTGGRSIIIVLALPVILVVLPRLKEARWFAIPLGLVAGLLYIIQITDERTAKYRSGGSGFVEWLDWEWGRFSMLGFAVRYGNEHGLLYGETLLAGLARFFDGAFRLVGLSTTETPLRTSMNIAAESLLNSSTEIYIVPGMSAELYQNFGMAGLVFGYLFLGRLCAWVDRRFINSSTLLTQIAWAYVGTLLVLRTINLDSASGYTYLIFSGAPLLLLAAISYVAQHRSGGADADVSESSATGQGESSPVTGRSMLARRTSANPRSYSVHAR